MKPDVKVTFNNTHVTVVMDREAASVVVEALEGCSYEVGTRRGDRKRDIAATVAARLGETLLQGKVAYRHKEA